jgi:hypothetical protein
MQAAETNLQRLISGMKPFRVLLFQRGSEAEHVASTVRSMPPLTSLAVNAQPSPYTQVDVRPHYERVSTGDVRV